MTNSKPIRPAASYRHSTAYTILPAVGLALFLNACGSDPVDMTQINTTGEARLALAAGVEARRDEVAAYLANHYFTRFSVLATTQGPHGETVDWVDPRELDPNFEAAVPPPHEDESPLIEGAGVAKDAPLEETLSLGSDYEFRDRWEELNRAAPLGTVPILRRNFRAYIEGLVDDDATLPTRGCP